MMPFTRQLLALLLLLAMVGCSSQPKLPQPDAPSWQQRQQRLLPLSRWQIQGKINIRTANDSTTANLNWSQQDDHYQIYMAGPLGQGAINIKGSDRLGVTLEISGEERRQATSPERLLSQRLGWSVPVSQMPYWIRGIPAPQSPFAMSLDPHNRLQQLTQSGWSIHYVSYQTEPATLRSDPLQLPRKIVLSRGDDLKLTLIVKQWQLNPLAEQKTARQN